MRIFSSAFDTFAHSALLAFVLGLLTLSAHSALSATPTVAVGGGVEFVACGSKGRQGQVLGYVLPDRTVIRRDTDERAGEIADLPDWRLQYFIKVLPEGAPAYRKVVSGNCFEPVDRLADDPVPTPELPRVELAVNGRLFNCTPQPAP